MTYTEKYRPKKFEDVKGQDIAVARIKKFIGDFHLGKITKTRKKALVLHGPTGTGKTTIAHVIANETNSEIFELNASDIRNKTKLQEVLKPAIEQQSLTKKDKIILVDEVDGISGYYDKGGVQELVTLIFLTNYPIIITANNIWSKKLNSLRQKSELVHIKQTSSKIIINILIDILRKEGLFVEHNVLKDIATKAKGDIRAAINDLQSVAKVQDSSELQLDERNKEKDIFNALRQVFKEKPSQETLNIFDSVNMNLDEIILWVEENIPNEYHGEELARAYQLLAKVDLFKGRIYKQQYWRFLVYENIFLSYGISSAKKQQNTNFTTYKKPTRILKIWLNNQRTAKKKSIAQKYAKYVHVGQKRALNEFPIIKNIINSNPLIQNELKLTEDEVMYLER